MLPLWGGSLFAIVELALKMTLSGLLRSMSRLLNIISGTFVKGKIIKLLSFVAVLILIMKPETLALGLMLDSIGIELFVLLLSMQLSLYATYVFHAWLKPVLKPLYLQYRRFDEEFFIPTLSEIKSSPILILHAVPGFFFTFKFIWLIRTNSYRQMA
jgi:hypothetical protein